MRKNPGQVITRYEVCQLISKAYLKAFTPSNLIASFKKSGIFPYNKDVIDEHHFLGDALKPKVPGPPTDTPAANSDYRKFLDDLLPQPKPIETKKRKVGYRPGGVAITEEKIILKIKKVIQEKESANKKKVNPPKPQKEPSYEELDTSSSDESEMSESDVCCVCKRFSPPTLRGVLRRQVTFVDWGQCSCGHWTHLQFCVPENVDEIMNAGDFTCPHCKGEE